ncbi:MAG: diphosphate--fructose-6-phosphate 1-phosphotransferase [Clostridia bacterium]
MAQNHLLIVHGGGPTAVLNASLYGVIVEARKHSAIGRIYAAKGGCSGLLAQRWIDLTDLPKEKLEGLLYTPGSAIGTSRDPLTDEDYSKMPSILQKNGIKYLLMNGGNGTMNTCEKIYERLWQTEIQIIGIPKTMDNDLAMTDHAPGFGSAARYMAQSVAEVAADVRSLPIHVEIIEAAGRNTGWVTAAAALAYTAGVDTPDLLYMPERPFDEEIFLQDVQRLIDQKKGVVVVASEGLINKECEPIVKPIFRVGRATYFGDVSAYLAELVIKKLGYKARGDKPGLLGRASIPLVSSVDRREAILTGAEAVRAIIGGASGKMVGVVRESGCIYSVHTALFDLKDVTRGERILPDEFINAKGNGVTQAFIDWCLPLIGESLPHMVSFE